LFNSITNISLFHSCLLSCSPSSRRWCSLCH